jgi:hypothetical protein
MIVEITHEEIDRALKKRTRNGDNKVPTQINGRPRKIWLMELGYSSDTRYMDKVMEKKEQHAELCKLLAAEGYDVTLLPIVLGSAGTLFKCLDRAPKEMDIPNARKKKLYSKLHLHSIHSLQNLVSQRRYLERQKPSAEALPGVTYDKRAHKNFAFTLFNEVRCVAVPTPKMPSASRIKCFTRGKGAFMRSYGRDYC